MRLRGGSIRDAVAAIAAACLIVIPVGATPVAAAPAQEPRLVVATWNVCKTACAAPAPSWDIRRERVARVIAEAGIDVLGVQEATLHATSSGRTQWSDIQAVAAPAGFVAPRIPLAANACRRPRDAAGELAGPSPCANTAGLLFRTDTVRQVESVNGIPTAGVVQLGSIAAMDPVSAVRSVMWAVLEGANGAGPFLAVSLHTSSLKTPEAEASRIALGNALAGWAQNLAASAGFPGIPIVLLADLNSYAKRQPAGVQSILVGSGWVDAFTAPTRRNIRYSTINYNPQLVDGFGFPVKPYVFRKTARNKRGEATRIDYIMALGNGVRFLDYEVVIRLDRAGRFIPEYQASDHQMVRATLAFTS